MAKSISTFLRAPSGPIDLGEFDPRATPGFKKGKSGAKKAQPKHAERLATLQEQLFADGRTGGTRNVLLVLQGHGHLGKDGTIRPRCRRRQSHGVRMARLRATTPTSAPRLPLADAPACPRRRA